MQYISNSEKDTSKIAKEVLKVLKPSSIVLLFGDLGAGKTTFVKSIVEAMGGNKNMVTSPTFTIVNEYDVSNQKVFHLDLYRIKSVEELFNIGIEDYLYGSGICFVEWPERAPELFDKYIKISIEKQGDTKRLFTLTENL